MIDKIAERRISAANRAADDYNKVITMIGACHGGKELVIAAFERAIESAYERGYVHGVTESATK